MNKLLYLGWCVNGEEDAVPVHRGYLVLRLVIARE